MPIGAPSGSVIVARRLTSSSRSTVVRRVDDAVWLASADVHEHPRVVPAGRPGPRSGPVDLAILQRSDVARTLVEDEVALIDQPLVDADPACHRARAMIRDHNDDRVVVEPTNDAADPIVDVHVVVVDRTRKAMVGFVLGMVGRHVLPERMVDAIHAHVDHHEEVVGLSVEQVLGDVEVLVGQAVDVAEDAILVI